MAERQVTQKELAEQRKAFNRQKKEMKEEVELMKLEYDFIQLKMLLPEKRAEYMEYLKKIQESNKELDKVAGELENKEEETPVMSIGTDIEEPLSTNIKTE